MPPSSIQYLSMNPETQIHSSLSTMISRAISSGFPNNNVPQGLHMFPVTEDLVSPSSVEAASNSGSGNSHSSSLLFSLSLLKDKLSQVQNLVGVLLSSDQSLPESTNPMVISSMNSTIQEIIVTATSMMFTCQQMALNNSTPPGTTATTCTEELHHHHHHHQHRSHHNNRLTQSNFTNNRSALSNVGPDTRGQSFFSSNNESEALQDWFSESYNNNNNNNNHNNNNNNVNCNLKDDDRIVAISETNNDDNTNNNEVYRGIRGVSLSPKNNNYDIVELDAADLLAKYTHYCQVCGKGFKRDANLRMHMRAHGDEYKTNSALSNPMKNKGRDCNLMSTISTKPKKYSCPQEGCRWNQKHAKFQPLKSIICAKNHYKRSHCPKMYVCKRCNQKQFSVLSDLRTHEKHCGDLKWQCSCGTTFSRKDKLMGHVALFVGHHPAIDATSSR